MKPVEKKPETPPKSNDDYPVIPVAPDSEDSKDDKPTVVGIPFLGGKGCSGDCKDGKKDLIHDLKN